MKKLPSYDEFLNESTENLDFKSMWLEFDKWAKDSKHPAWMHQKNKIKEIAPKYGIKLKDSDWSKIWGRYSELDKKFYFIPGWEYTKEWIEKKIKEYNK